MGEPIRFISRIWLTRNRERVLRIVSRCNGFLVILFQSVHYYEYGIELSATQNANGKGKDRAVEDGFWLEKKGEWQTCLNERGEVVVSFLHRPLTLHRPRCALCRRGQQRTDHPRPSTGTHPTRSTSTMSGQPDRKGTRAYPSA